jgi:hypothetical protein
MVKYKGREGALLYTEIYFHAYDCKNKLLVDEMDNVFEWSDIATD